MNNKEKSLNQWIGPHNIDIISFILGSLLGNLNLEKHDDGLKLIIEQYQQNIEYLYWYNNFFIDRSYAPNVLPKLKIRIAKHNKIFYYYKIYSYTFTSLNFLYDIFYINKKKVLPLNQSWWKWFTPLSLALWYMDDGSKTQSGLRLVPNNFNLEEIKFLRLLLKKKFNINTSIHASGSNKSYIIYIKSNSVNDFINIVNPYIHKSIYYKLTKSIPLKPKN